MPETPLPHNVSQADLFAEKQKAAKKDSIMKRLYPGTEGMTMHIPPKIAFTYTPPCLILTITL